jgi:hypothetical protein
VNRHERRAAAAERRRSKVCMWTDYIRHLPRVPLDAPEEAGRRYYTCVHHTVACRAFVTGRPDSDCDCGARTTKHVEPTRS